MKWFKHDSNANADAKLKRVKLKYGMEGYGLYWFCLELIAQGIEKHNLTFELEHDAEIISADTGIHQERVQEIMADFVKWMLFENTQGIITCMKMADRTDEYTQKLIRSRGNIGTTSRQCPDKVPPNRIEENRREQSNKKTRTKKFSPPTKQEVEQYCQERSNSVDPDRFIDHYTSNGWKVGKNSMKDWKAAVRTWEKNTGATNEKDTRSRAKRFSDTIDDIARKDIEANGFVDSLD